MPSPRRKIKQLFFPHDEEWRHLIALAGGIVGEEFADEFFGNAARRLAERERADVVCVENDRLATDFGRWR